MRYIQQIDKLRKCLIVANMMIAFKKLTMNNNFLRIKVDDVEDKHFLSYLLKFTIFLNY